MIRPDNWIAVLDFGSQYSQLIVRRIREQKVYAELIGFDSKAKDLLNRRPAGIVLSGGPASVTAAGAPSCDPALLQTDIPLLGICYGMQLIAQGMGGRVQPGTSREYGQATITLDPNRDALFKGLPENMTVWMSHGDQVGKTPEGFNILAGSSGCPVAAMAAPHRNIYGLQFHPEVVHTNHGSRIIQNFLFEICRCRPDWQMSDFVRQSVDQLRQCLNHDHVICGLSGGVDSAVVAALLHRAIGSRLHCIFVDNGLLRWRESEQVEETFGRALGMDLHVVHAQEQFIGALRGLTDPEDKRKAIGKVFIDVFSAEAKKMKKCRFLAQGTLYPDVIESISPNGGPSATIKSHHNVGGLPDDLSFELIEPLRELFKDEAREVGRLLGLPEDLVSRQPFPGPGLAVRILGEVTSERVQCLQQADLRVREELEKLPDAGNIWQSFAVLLPVRTVGVMGDSRTYENVCAIRAVQSVDGMTADWARIPDDCLARMSNRIINEVPGINRVVYDISSKPPATIEWE